jgi:hypothetical protein
MVVPSRQATVPQWETMNEQRVRIVPKGEQPLVVLTQMAMDRRWLLKKALTRNASERKNGEYEFLVPEGDSRVILRDDVSVGIKFYTVLGEKREALAAEIRKEVEHWTELELLSWWDRAVESGDTDEKVVAVLFLGVGATEHPQPEYVQRIKEGLLDADKDVRSAAVAAVAYANWRLFWDDLLQIVASDPSAAARQRAAAIIDDWTAEDSRP